MARRLDTPSGQPLIPIEDGLTQAERQAAWDAWDAEWDAAPVAEVDVTAAETLAEVRAAGVV